VTSTSAAEAAPSPGGAARLTGWFDPRGLATRLVTAGLFETSVVYERDWTWSVAGGRRRHIELFADRIRIDSDGCAPTTSRRTVDDPVAELRAALGAVARPWRAYGWLAFEFAYAADHRPVPRDAPLAQFVVPVAQLRLRTDSVEVDCEDQALRERILHTVTTSTPMPFPVPASVDVEMSDPGPYLRAVEAAVAGIRRHDLEKVILSRRVPVPFDLDYPATYLLGRAAHTPARSFLLDLPGMRAAGFSPETVVEVSTEGHVRTQPLAGTRLRTGEATADAAALAELTTDPKEIYEHAVSVKLADTELRTVCTPASVSVSDFMSVKSRGSVHHLASAVGGRLRAGLTGWDALAALFPAVTASGIPKPAAYDLIASLEEAPRGLYSGAVVTAADDGTLDAALALRTVYTQDGRTWLRAGAGVVAASRPEREYPETCEKLASVAPYLVPIRRSPR